LRRVFDLFWTERRPYYATLPTRRNPSGIHDPAEREAFIARFRAAARDGGAAVPAADQGFGSPPSRG